MKEKKNKNTNEEKLPSKGKIMFAWILLIILIGCTAGLVYVKNFKTTTEEMDETVNKVETPAIILEALGVITDAFNQNVLITQYKQEEISLNATQNDKTITITYQTNDSNGSIDYVYDTKTANLVANVTSDQEEINRSIYKIMVLACRKRSNLSEDVEDKIDSFFVGEELSGLKREETTSGYTYYIDIRNPLEEQTTSTDSSTTTDNQTVEDNTKNNTSNSDTSSTNTTTSENNISTSEVVTEPENNSNSSQDNITSEVIQNNTNTDTSNVIE